MFGLPLRDVPNFIESPDGYYAAIGAFYKQRKEDGRCVKVILGNGAAVPNEYKDKVCILRGKSPRGDFGHVVVARHLATGGFEMIHDPHPEAAFLDESEEYGWCLFFV